MYSIETVSFPASKTTNQKQIPLLELIRQLRDKNYFYSTTKTNFLHQDLTDSLSSTSSRRIDIPLAPSFHHIPEEMRISSREVVKENVRYYINEQKNVFGELILIPSTIIFEPALDDPVTQMIGIMNCQFKCDLKDVLEVNLIDASEILSAWQLKNAQASSPTLSKNTNTSGPSSQHLDLRSVHEMKFENDDSVNNLKFLQLVVMLSKPNEGTTTGKIIYFLINQQSIEIFYQKLLVWSAQSKPVNDLKSDKSSNILAKPITSSFLNQDLNPSPLEYKSIISPISIVQPQPEKTLDEQSIKLPHLNVDSAILGKSEKIQKILKKLTFSLPPRLQNSDLTLLYSTERHGISLQTFFLKTKRKGPSYIIIEDQDGFQFGAFISQSWEIQKGYYGTGECFLFTIYPTFNVYPWSGLNEFFIYSREDTIAVGGGSGKFGICLDKELFQGSSSPCDTFLNTTLSCQQDFICTIVEVWGFEEFKISE